MEYVLHDHIKLKVREDDQIISIKYYDEKKTSTKIILMTSAMAVKQHFYRKFAHFLVKHGFIVYTLDYSGIGLSKTKKIRRYNSDILDWKDEIDATIKYITQIHQAEKLYYIGHSLGGQLFGLLEDMDSFDKMIAITSQNGYWRYYGGWNFRIFWYFLVPLTSHIFGYFPSRIFGMGEKVPKKAMLQWRSWCTQENYLFGDAQLDPKHNTYQNPVLFWSFSDDPYAPKDAVEYMINQYTSTNPEHKHIIPDNIGMESIGHFGFFRKKSEKLWEETIKWLEDK